MRDGTIGDADIGVNSISNDELPASVRSRRCSTGRCATRTSRAGCSRATRACASTTSRFPASVTAGEDVACPAGQRALGGGVSFGSLNADDRVVFSEPRVGADCPERAGRGGERLGRHDPQRRGDERTASVWVVCAAR